MNILQDPVSKILVVKIENADNSIVVKSGTVRVPASTVIWKVTPLDNDSLSIEYYGQADPGGSVPAWAANSFVQKARSKHSGIYVTYFLTCLCKSKFRFYKRIIFHAKTQRNSRKSAKKFHASREAAERLPSPFSPLLLTKHTSSSPPQQNYSRVQHYNIFRRRR